MQPVENEIKTHFRLKAPSIKQQIEKWRALDDGEATAADGEYSSSPLKDGNKDSAIHSGVTSDFAKKAQALLTLLECTEEEMMVV